MGHSPHLIPPLSLAVVKQIPELECTTQLMNKLILDVQDAKDNLLQAKCLQAYHTNKSQSEDDIFKVGDKVMLSTLHCRKELAAGDTSCIAKFFPHFDSPYKIINSMPDFSAYTLELPNSNIFPTFHVSQLK
jgi:hypothetical protein